MSWLWERIRRWGVLVCAAACGVCVAYVVYAYEISERVAHALEGGVVAFLVALAGVAFVSRRQRLTWKKLKIDVPFVGEAEFEIEKHEEKKFAITEAQRTVGWRIYVEVVTRVLVQRSSTYAEAETNENDAVGTLGSIHACMQAIRVALSSHACPPPSGEHGVYTVETLAAWIMNAARVFLGKWRPKLEPKPGPPPKELTKDYANDFGKLQLTLIGYATTLSRLLEVPEPDAFRTLGAPTTKPDTTAEREVS